MVKATDGDGPLTAAQRRKIIADIEELLATDEKLTTRVVARNIGCGRSTLSQLLSGKYKGTGDKYLRAGCRWMADRADRAKTPQAAYVRTSVGDYILTVCRRAADGPCIGQVVTPSGAGKTAALMEFARARGDRAVYLQAGYAFSSPGGLIGELARKLRIVITTRSTSATLYAQIRDKLADYYAGGRGDPFVVLVDEATTLRPTALNTLRNLHDDPACRVAIVLADTGRLTRELTKRGGWAMYEQLRSRFGAAYLLGIDEEIPLADVQAVADSALAGLGHTRKLSKRAYEYLRRIAQDDGKLRNVVYRLHAVDWTARSAKIVPAFSAAELDFVADLVGAEPFNKAAPMPFGRPDHPARSARAEVA